MFSARNTAFLLISLLLHLVALFYLGEFRREEEEVESFRARLVYQPHFEPPRLPVAPLEVPPAQMEYLPPEAGAPGAPQAPAAAPQTPPLEAVPAPPALAEEAEVGVKAEAPQFARQEAPAPWRQVRIDTAAGEGMELLRLEDLARADDKRAVIIPDPYSRRDLEGFINFTYLYMDGIGNRGPVLGDLARYLRDHSKILARVRGVPRPYFLSPELLKDPIHFMFPRPRLGGSETEGYTYMSPEETELLGHYLHEGGFLFVEGPAEPHRPGTVFWLNEMMMHVYQALGGEGRLFEIPLSHDIYHSFYDFGDGFPGYFDDQSIAAAQADPGARSSSRDNSNPGPGRLIREEKLPEVEIPAWYFARGRKDRYGLWGAELDGRLVAVFSDMNLHRNWRIGTGEEDANPGSERYMQAAVNIVVYALTRPGGLTTRRARPAWRPPRPQEPLAARESSPLAVEEASAAFEDEELFALMDASLALVHTPLGRRIGDEGLRVQLDGGYALELLKGGQHGILLRHVPPGRHRVELYYGGKKKTLEVDMEGDRVLTLSFGLNRLAFFRKLRLKAQKDQVQVSDWLGRFSDLEIEEVFYREN